MPELYEPRAEAEKKAETLQKLEAAKVDLAELPVEADKVERAQATFNLAHQEQNCGLAAEAIEHYN